MGGPLEAQGLTSCASRTGTGVKQKKKKSIRTESGHSKHWPPGHWVALMVLCGVNRFSDEHTKYTQICLYIPHIHELALIIIIIFLYSSYLLLHFVHKHYEPPPNSTSIFSTAHYFRSIIVNKTHRKILISTSYYKNVFFLHIPIIHQVVQLLILKFNIHRCNNISLTLCILAYSRF